MKEKPAKFVWSMDMTSVVSVGVSWAGWKVKSSSKLLASDGPFCMRENADFVPSVTFDPPCIIVYSQPHT